MAFLFILLALFALFFAIKLFGKKKEKKESFTHSPDIPVVTYEIDLVKELRRIYYEQGTGNATCDKQETLEEIEHSERVSRLSSDIANLISIIEALINDPSPYPTQVATKMDEASVIHNRILKSKKKLYTQAITITLARKDLSDSQIKLLDRYSTNPKAFDLPSIKLLLFDRYFLNYRNYWEKQISQLSRQSAIINRRKYLVEKCGEWKVFLISQRIKKYNTILDEYSRFNISELNLLERK